MLGSWGLVFKLSHPVCEERQVLYLSMQDDFVFVLLNDFAQRRDNKKM